MKEASKTQRGTEIKQARQNLIQAAGDVTDAIRVINGRMNQIRDEIISSLRLLDDVLKEIQEDK
jgi:hypothetical protein